MRTGLPQHRCAAAAGAWADAERRGPVITMDGPAGAGKSTIARRVAERLGLFYVDTGAMYRAVALAALRAGLDPRDRRALARSTGSAAIQLRPGLGGESRVWMGGEDVTGALRGPAVDQVVPVVAGAPAVREILMAEQRRLAAQGGVVVDGRDIGSVVLPDADHKFFVTAELGVRARRRLEQLRSRGFDATLEDVERDIAQRDELDAARTRPAADAIRLDTTLLTVGEAVARILAEIGARAEGPAGGCEPGRPFGTETSPGVRR